MGFDQLSLLVGFIAGFFVSGYLGWTMQNLRRARGELGAPYRPMSIATKDTPQAVLRRAGAAFWRMVRWTLLFTLGLVILFLILYQLIVGPG